MLGCSWSRFLFFTVASAAGLGLLLRELRKADICESKTDLDGKTVLLTGGNTGIGKETAIGLAKRNARVIIACRNAEKAKVATEEIRKASGNVKVEYLLLDLADLKDIRRFAKELMEREEKLDILINNAAAVDKGKTKDGFGLMFGVNQLGPFLLTNLLLPLMRETSKKRPVRIINVSSEAYRVGRIDFNNLDPSVDESSSFVNNFMVYASTKLMNIHFTNELDRRLKEEFPDGQQAITTYSLHPGTIQSDLGKSLGDSLGGFRKFLRDTWMNFIALPTFYGAQASLCCSLEEGIEKYSGMYFNVLKPTELEPHATDPTVSKKLWEVCERLTGLSK